MNTDLGEIVNQSKKMDCLCVVCGEPASEHRAFPCCHVACNGCFRDFMAGNTQVFPDGVFHEFFSLRHPCMDGTPTGSEEKKRKREPGSDSEPEPPGPVQETTPPSVECPACKHTWLVVVDPTRTKPWRFFLPWVYSQVDSLIIQRRLRQAGCQLCGSPDSPDSQHQYCTRCGILVCKACHDLHLRLHPGHSHCTRSLPACLANPEVLRKQFSCKTHLNQPIAGFCEQDGVPVCMECMLLPEEDPASHNGHRLAKILPTAHRLRKELVEMCSSLVSRREAVREIRAHLEGLVSGLEHLVGCASLASMSLPGGPGGLPSLPAASILDRIKGYREAKLLDIGAAQEANRQCALDLDTTAQLLGWILDPSRTTEHELVVGYPVVKHINDSLVAWASTKLAARFSHPLYLYLRYHPDTGSLETGETIPSRLAMASDLPQQSVWLQPPASPISLRLAAVNYLQERLPPSSIGPLTARRRLVSTGELILEETPVHVDADGVLQLQPLCAGPNRDRDRDQDRDGIIKIIISFVATGLVAMPPLRFKEVCLPSIPGVLALQQDGLSHVPITARILVQPGSPLLISPGGTFFFCSTFALVHSTPCPTPLSRGLAFTTSILASTSSEPAVHLTMDPQTGDLLVVRENSTIEIHRHSGEPISMIPFNDRRRVPHEEWIRTPMACAVSPIQGGDYIISDRTSRRIVFVDRERLRIRALLTQKLDFEPGALALSGCGRYLVVAPAGRGMLWVVNLMTTMSYSLKTPKAFTRPTHLVVDAANNILVVDAGTSRISVVNLLTGALGLVVSLTSGVPHSAAISPGGDLYISTQAGELLLFPSIAWTKKEIDGVEWGMGSSGA